MHIPIDCEHVEKRKEKSPISQFVIVNMSFVYCFYLKEYTLLKPLNICVYCNNNF